MLGEGRGNVHEGGYAVRVLIVLFRAGEVGMMSVSLISIKEKKEEMAVSPPHTQQAAPQPASCHPTTR